MWFPKNQRLAATDQMFGTPYYSGLLLEQSMLYNRRADSGKIRHASYHMMRDALINYIIRPVSNMIVIMFLRL